MKKKKKKNEEFGGEFNVDFVDNRLKTDEVMEKIYGEYEGKFDEDTFTDEVFHALLDYFDCEVVRAANVISMRFRNGKRFKLTIKETTRETKKDVR